MKALACLFLILWGQTSAQASSLCEALFTADKRSFQAHSARSNTSSFKDRFENLKSLVGRIEIAKSQNKTNAEIVKMKTPELTGDLLKQIEFLKKPLKDSTYKSTFIKSLIQHHVQTLESAQRVGLNLEQHYRLSLKTTLLLEEWHMNPNRETSSVFRFTPLQKERLEKFIKDQISDKDFVKSFPKMNEFFSEWTKSLSVKDNRILLFSTLESSLAKFNLFLSPDISFIGLSNRISHPDGQTNAAGPLGFASHDISHHQLYREQFKDWRQTGLSYEQKRKFLIALRNHYLEARRELPLEQQMSLDFLYFSTLHEDINVLHKYLHNGRGLYAQRTSYEKDYILDYNQLQNLSSIAQFTSANEVQASSIRKLLDKRSSPKKLHEELYPTWEILTHLWNKSYDNATRP